MQKTLWEVAEAQSTLKSQIEELTQVMRDTIAAAALGSTSSQRTTPNYRQEGGHAGDVRASMDHGLPPIGFRSMS